MPMHAAYPRRGLIAGVTLAAALAPALVTAAPASGAPPGEISAEEFWVQKGAVKLYVYRKHMGPPAGKPVLFLVHGSSFSGRGGFDLHVPGHPDYSMMEVFAARGFDVWTMDHEGYGRSSRTASNSDIASGVADLEAALPLVERVTGTRAVAMYGQSSGALRAGAFAVANPERVARIVLDAFTYTGEGAPEIMRRRAQAATYRANPHRTMTRAAFTAIFSRDDPSTFEAAVPAALADYELALGDTVPSGTYLDMAVNMPRVDPKRLVCPVLMVRAATDGNATIPELLDFFTQLPARDKQFAMVAGVAHVAVLGTNRARVFHVMREFLTLPPLA